jgi:hypothetical protein
MAQRLPLELVELIGQFAFEPDLLQMRASSREFASVLTEHAFRTVSFRLDLGPRGTRPDATRLSEDLSHLAPLIKLVMLYCPDMETTRGGEYIRHLIIEASAMSPTYRGD